MFAFDELMLVKGEFRVHCDSGCSCYLTLDIAQHRRFNRIFAAHLLCKFKEWIYKSQGLVVTQADLDSFGCL